MIENTMKLFVLCLLVFFAVGTQAQYHDNVDFESCTTPDEKIGACVNIRRCPVLLNLLQHRPLSPYAEEQLRRSRCGFEGVDPKVCCSLDQSNGNGGDTETTSKPIGGGGSSSEGKGPFTSDLLPNTDVCGISVADKIIGGVVAKLEEFPWMALIEYQKPNGRGFYCGGTLISSRYVLTAAHCVKGKDLPPSWRLASVRLGEHDTNSDRDCDTVQGSEYCSDPPVNVPVVEQIAHEKYDAYSSSQHHDIALLRLARDVQFTDWIKPICVPTSSYLLNKQFTDTNMTVAGWGKTETRSSSNLKLKLDITVKSNTECSSVYGNRVTFGDGQMCAGGKKGKDSCTGDSGGPLMILDARSGESNYFIAGIVSFGPNPCGLEGWPGVYTRVTEYIPWLISKLKP